jgi:hypothetical protein
MMRPRRQLSHPAFEILGVDKRIEFRLARELSGRGVAARVGAAASMPANVATPTTPRTSGRILMGNGSALTKRAAAQGDNVEL